jgi:hypothetical protein
VELKKPSGLFGAAIYAFAACSLVTLGLVLSLFVARRPPPMRAETLSELEVTESKRTAVQAEKDRDSAKAETAMCRRAIGYADASVANLENALKKERAK